MSEARYNVILTGHIQAGQDHTAVAARLAALMKQPQEKTANLLQGRASRVKSNLDTASAQRYWSRAHEDSPGFARRSGSLRANQARCVTSDSRSDMLRSQLGIQREESTRTNNTT